MARSLFLDHVNGSCVYRLDLRTEDERRKKAQIAKRERLDREQHLEIEAAKQADIVQKKEKAALIGTSWKHVESRSRMMFKYIRLNDMFHAAMTRIREKQLQNLGNTKVQKALRKEMNGFLKSFPSFWWDKSLYEDCT